MIHPGVQFVSVCEHVKLKKQVFCSQHITVRQAYDNNYRHSGLKKGRNRRKIKEVTGPKQFQNPAEQSIFGFKVYEFLWFQTMWFSNSVAHGFTL